MEKHEVVSLIIEVTADQRSQLFALREIATMAFFSSLHSLNKTDAEKIISTTKKRLEGIRDDQIRMLVDLDSKEDRTNYSLAKHLREQAESFLEMVEKWEGQMKMKERL